YFTQTAMGIRECLGVFGDDCETGDGTAVRGYTEVNDLAEAHVKAMQRLLEAKNKVNLEFVNLGSGTGATVLETVDLVEQANNLKIKHEIKERRAGDIVEAYADYSHAETALGWRPKTPLEVSMQTAWAFQRKL